MTSRGRRRSSVGAGRSAFDVDYALAKASSVAPLSVGVDPGDPAISEIVNAAKQLREFGFDPSNPDVASRAVAVGRSRHQERLRSTHARRSYLAALEYPPGSVVYYMRVGTRVKIGCTVNLRARVQALSPEAVLATEPGSYDVEAVRHEQFRHLRTHNEWFKLEEPLVMHIRKLILLST